MMKCKEEENGNANNSVSQQISSANKKIKVEGKVLQPSFATEFETKPGIGNSMFKLETWRTLYSEVYPWVRVWGPGKPLSAVNLGFGNSAKNSKSS